MTHVYQNHRYNNLYDLSTNPKTTSLQSFSSEYVRYPRTYPLLIITLNLNIRLQQKATI